MPRLPSLAFTLLLFLSLGWAPLPSFAAGQGFAALESPSTAFFQESGVSLIRGWVCQASKVEISIDGGPLQTAGYGTDRPDTEAVCGDRNNGFGLTINWGNIGEGAHTLRAFADSVEFAKVDFVVATLGASFLTGLQGEYTLKDFPTPGSSPTIAWSGPHQNFVFTKNLAVPTVPNLPISPREALESPTQGSAESGVGLIRGWVCQAASRVEVSIDGGPLLTTAYGTERLDTQSACGDTNNGFGLTYNWNEIGDGIHNLRAVRDGVVFANVNFAVATLGSKFLTGLSSAFSLVDFPIAGETTTVSWSEPHQNFVIAKSTVSTSPDIICMIYATERASFSTPTSGSSRRDDVAVGGETGSIKIKPDIGILRCPSSRTWSVISYLPWITFTPESGIGEGTITYTVSRNTSLNNRAGYIYVYWEELNTNTALYISQQGETFKDCSATLSTLGFGVRSDGDTDTISVTIPSDCSWSAISTFPWITLQEPASGVGPGTVSYTVSRNDTETSRTGTLAIAGQTVTVIQGGISIK